MKWAPAILLALLVVVQGDLWFGKGNLPYVWGLQKQLAQQQATNAAARERNARLVAEVSDLKEGLEMVEEKARAELGMVRADEILVQLSAPKTPTAPAARP
jgi:cell division protein FtsB